MNLLFSPRTIQNTKKEAKNIEIIKLVVSGKSSVIEVCVFLFSSLQSVQKTVLLCL